MSAKRGLSASILVNGVDISTFLRTVAPSLDMQLLDATTFQAANGDKIFVSGFRDGKLSLEGFFDSDAVTQAEIDDLFNSVLGSETKQVATISPEGALTLGNRCYLIDADTVRYGVQSPATGLIQCNAEIQSSSGLGYGVILQPKAALTATGNGSSVDNAASSANGGAGHLHVTAKSGTTPSITGKIQHSADNSTWADLITFTALTDTGAQRVEVTGTVNRYMRFIRTISGTSPSFDVTAGFARF